MYLYHIDFYRLFWFSELLFGHIHSLLSQVSPFANLLHSLRMKYGIRQVDLAALIGYDQTYISAMESSLKGPPAEEFVNRLAEALPLTQQEQQELLLAADASQRKLIVDLDTHEEAYWLLKALRDNFRTLSSRQIRMIRDVLELPGESTAGVASIEAEPVRRLRRRPRLEASM